jgi:hypothetical protein
VAVARNACSSFIAGHLASSVTRPCQHSVEFAAKQLFDKLTRSSPHLALRGGQFVLHAKALHGNPYDGHTLGPVIADLEKITGVAVRRIHGDKGYRGHNYPDRFKVWISGQAHRVKVGKADIVRAFIIAAVSISKVAASSTNFCFICPLNN